MGRQDQHADTDTGRRAAHDDAPHDMLPARGIGRRHWQLREATKKVHEHLDAATVKAGYFASAEKFAGYLERLLAFHRVYGPAAECHDPERWCARWAIDRHPHWISHELSLIDGGERSSQRKPDLVFHGKSGVLGSLYVLAGSTLGARMLHKMTARCSVPAAGGSSYLAALGSSVRWVDFLAFLEAADIGGDDAGMVDGALATFRAVHTSLETTA